MRNAFARPGFGGAPDRVRPVALAIALLMIASSVFAANHCELGGMEKPLERAHSCCTPSPSDAPVPLEYSQCCAPLEAPLPVVVHAPIVQFAEIFAVWADAMILPAPDVELVCVFGESAPPGSSFLLEQVLRRSVPAHAPPVFVA